MSGLHHWGLKVRVTNPTLSCDKDGEAVTLHGRTGVLLGVCVTVPLVQGRKPDGNSHGSWANRAGTPRLPGSVRGPPFCAPHTALSPLQGVDWTSYTPASLLQVTPQGST